MVSRFNMKNPHQQLFPLIKQCFHELATDRNFDYLYWVCKVFDNFMNRCFRLLGYLLVLLAYTLICSIALSGFCITLPFVAPNKLSFWYLFNYTLGIIIVVNLLFNYSMAVLSSPGHPSLEHVQHLPEYRQCKKCDLPKPERAHHCSICKKCVLKVGSIDALIIFNSRVIALLICVIIYVIFIVRSSLSM